MPAFGTAGPSALPVALLAHRQPRRLPHGTEAWRVLRGLLLDPDGITVSRRRDEPAVDRGDRHLRPTGENDSVRGRERAVRGRRNDPGWRGEFGPVMPTRSTPFIRAA